jgi:hypothetical protein
MPFTPTEGYSTVDLGIRHADSSACFARKTPAMIISLLLLERAKKKIALIPIYNIDTVGIPTEHIPTVHTQLIFQLD